jgi:hypothetical protein
LAALTILVGRDGHVDVAHEDNRPETAVATLGLEFLLGEDFRHGVGGGELGADLVAGEIGDRKLPVVVRQLYGLDEPGAYVQPDEVPGRHRLETAPRERVVR